MIRQAEEQLFLYIRKVNDDKTLSPVPSRQGANWENRKCKKCRKCGNARDLIVHAGGRNQLNRIVAREWEE